MTGGELHAVCTNRRDLMKMLTKLFLSLCVVIGLGAVMMTEAQIESDITIRANIPHPFVVRDTTLPAGEYTIKVADEYSDPNVLEIQSVKGNMSVMFDTD